MGREPAHVHLGEVVENIEEKVRHDRLPISRSKTHLPHAWSAGGCASGGHDGAGRPHGPRDFSGIRAHPDRCAETSATPHRTSSNSGDESRTQGPSTRPQESAQHATATGKSRLRFCFIDLSLATTNKSPI